MVRGDLVKLFRKTRGKYRWCRSTRVSFRSQLSVGCSDGMAYKYAACGRLWLLSPVCERHARQPPARPEKWVSKRGTLRFIQAMTPVALELRTSAFAMLRPAVRLFRCPSGDATEQPQHQSSPRRLIKHTADRQVRRTVVAGVPP